MSADGFGSSAKACAYCCTIGCLPADWIVFHLMLKNYISPQEQRHRRCTDPRFHPPIPDHTSGAVLVVGLFCTSKLTPFSIVLSDDRGCPLTDSHRVAIVAGRVIITVMPLWGSSCSFMVLWAYARSSKKLPQGSKAYPYDTSSVLYHVLATTCAGKGSSMQPASMGCTQRLCCGRRQDVERLQKRGRDAAREGMKLLYRARF